MLSKNDLIDLLILFLGVFGALLCFYQLIRGDLREWLGKPESPSKPDNSVSLLSLRLQAHERMIIFIDRINPTNLLLRVHFQGIGLIDLQNAVLDDIQSEFQHNITQQLYISASSWSLIRKLKDDTIAMINNGVKALPEEATGIDLCKKILQHMSTIVENPYELTIEHLKKEIHQLN